MILPPLKFSFLRLFLLLWFSLWGSWSQAQSNVFDQASGANVYFGGFGNFNWVASWSGFLPTAGTQLFASANGNAFPYNNIGMTKTLGGIMANTTYTVSLNTGYYYATPITYPIYHQLYIGSGLGTMSWTSTPNPSAPDVWYTWTGTYTPAVGDIGQPFSFHMNMDLLANSSFVLDLNINFAVLLQLGMFQGQLNEDDVELFWQAENLESVSAFQLERSIDGRLFERISEIPISSNADYTYTDLQAANLDAEVLYYRIGQLDINGEQQYTDVVAVKLHDQKLPSIVNHWFDESTETLHIVLSQEREVTGLRLTNALGQIIWEATPEPQSVHEEIPVENVTGGIYFLSAATAEGTEVIKTLLRK